MSHHPSYAYGALLTAGGIAGYVKGKSVPSLVAGVTLGLSYFASAYLIKQGQSFNGHLIAEVSSFVLMAAGLSRLRKVGAKPVPVALASLGALMLAYQTKKVMQWKDDPEAIIRL